MIVILNTILTLYLHHRTAILIVIAHKGLVCGFLKLKKFAAVLDDLLLFYMGFDGGIFDLVAERFFV